MLDVYACPKNHEFAVKDGQEPNGCPFCGRMDISFSHKVRDLSGILVDESELKENLLLQQEIVSK